MTTPAPSQASSDLAYSPHGENEVPEEIFMGSALSVADTGRL
jgi:hypothetical protein